MGARQGAEIESAILLRHRQVEGNRENLTTLRRSNAHLVRGTTRSYELEASECAAVALVDRRTTAGGRFADAKRPSNMSADRPCGMAWFGDYDLNFNVYSLGVRRGMFVWLYFKFIHDLLHVGDFLGERFSFLFLVGSLY